MSAGITCVERQGALNDLSFKILGKFSRQHFVLGRGARALLSLFVWDAAIIRSFDRAVWR